MIKIRASGADIIITDNSGTPLGITLNSSGEAITVTDNSGASLGVTL